MSLNRTLAAAIAAALPLAAPAETAITVYSSASPGSLNARTLAQGYGAPSTSRPGERCFASTMCPHSSTPRR